MSEGHDWPVEVWAELAEARRKMPRNRVHDLVRHGKLTPECAEAWALERGKPKFARKPEPGKYDPVALIDWTLAMATAWIIWRTPQAVRECMEAYVKECTDWVPCSYRRPAHRGTAPSHHVRGFVLESPNTPTPADVLIKVPTGKALGSVVMVELEQAKRELRDALRNGELLARGGRQADPIEKTRWIALSPFDPPRHRGPHNAVYDDNGDVQFSGVTVERDDVMKQWPAKAKPKSGKRPGVKPTLRASLSARMLADLRAGTLGREEKQEALARRYGASRETCVAAYRDALSEFEFPTNADTDPISTV